MSRTALALPFSGARLRTWRERAGLSQQALAAECGLSRYQITRWETGIAKPEPQSLRPLERTGGSTGSPVHSDELLDGQTYSTKASDQG